MLEFMKIFKKSLLYTSMIVFLLAITMPSLVVKSQTESSTCQLFTAANSVSPNVTLDESFLLLLPRGSAVVSIWSFAEARPVGILPFSAAVSSWEQPYGNPFTQGTPIRADTFRIPQISSDGQYIAYATAYSQQDLSRSLQFIWSTAENRVFSTFPWYPNWIHAIGWIDQNHLGFLAQDDELTIEIVNLEGAVTEIIPLDWLEFFIPSAPWSVPRQSTYFFLWSTFAPQSGNLLIWYRADVEEESRVVAFNIYNQRIFFERHADEFISLLGGAAFQNPGAGSPSWSHSGQRLAIPLYDINFNRNLYLLSEDETLQQVTFFSEGDTAWQFSVDFATWSPNDRWLAFWVYKSGEQAELYLLDVDSNQLLNTSILYSASPALFWSPDSRYLGFWQFSDNALGVLDFEACTSHEIPSDEGGLFFDQILGWGAFPLPTQG